MSLKLFFDLLLDKLRLTPYHRRRKKYDIGEYSYICHTTKMGAVKIGKFCSIGNDVILGAGNHPYDTITTSPFIYSRKKVAMLGNILVAEDNLWKPEQKSPEQSMAIIENDVWIGARAIVKCGVRVHNGAIIGAGAVVTHDVPPYAIVAGVPAKVIKYRFDEETIKKLEDLKWWDYPKDFIVKLPFADINKCIAILEENKYLKR